MRRCATMATAVAWLAFAATAVTFAQSNELEAIGDTITIVSEAGGSSRQAEEVRVIAGGPIDTTGIEGIDAGWITDAPTVRLDYQASEHPLYVYAMSDADTTLLVRTPDGAWHSNDDSKGITKTLPLYGVVLVQGNSCYECPALGFPEPESGVYTIWVGTFREGTARAELVIAEVEPDGF